MAVTSVTGFLYGVVRESWMVASLVLKYFLLANIAYLLYRNDLSWESFQEKILEQGKPVLLGMGAVGLVFHVSGVSVEPIFRLFSQVVAVGVLGFLFWKY